MIGKKIFNVSMIGLAIVLIIGTYSALADANTVPVSYAMDILIPIEQSQLIPSQCAGMVFDNIIADSGDIAGGPGNDNIRGGMGDDCIIGGGGNDTLRGQNGDDLLIGGSGYDIIEGGPGYDTCIYGDDVKDCEVVN